MTLLNSKLLQLIDYLYQLEKEVELNRFIIRQYPNNRNNDLKLWKFIMKYWDTEKDESYLKYDVIDEIIFKSKVPERNRSMHELYKKVKVFMIVEEVASDDLIYEWMYWRTLQQRDNRLDTEVTASLDEQFDIEKMRGQSAMRQFAAFDFHLKKYQKKASKTLLISEDSLLHAKTYLNLFYNQNLTDIDNELKEMRRINEEKKISVKEEKIAVDDIDTRIGQINKETTKEWFLDFLHEVMNNKWISNSRKSTYLQHFVNASHGIYLKGNQIMTNVWDEFIEYGFAQKYFHLGEHLSLQIYLNFLSISLRIDKETFDFIVQNYTSNLSKIEQPKGMLFAKIFRASQNKQYQKIIDLITKSNLSFRNEFVLKIRIHTFLIRAYYELRPIKIVKKKKKILLKEDNIKVRTALNHYKNYLNRTQQSKLIISRNKLFIHQTRAILNTKTVIDLENLREEMKLKSLIYKNWLMEKIEERMELLQEVEKQRGEISQGTTTVVIP